MVSPQRRGVGFSIMPSNPKKNMCKVYKVIVLGDSGVGKSSLLRRMTDWVTESNMNKDYLSKMAIVEGASAPVKVQLWDTAGQEKFGAARLPSSFFRHADAALVVYDVMNRQSFVSVLRWVLQIQAYRTTAAADSEFSLVLVGHKCDVHKAQMQVHDAEGLEFAKLVAASHHFNCSSKDGTNVQECFDAVATELVNGTSWALSTTQLPSIDVAKPHGLFRLSAPRSNLDVSSPPDTASITTVCSPTLKALSTKSESFNVSTPYIGTFAALLSMPMVFLWLDDDAVLRWAEALGIQ